MSGDVQPRKRKDKKRKKDELGVEEPRGTSAALGEGDVFMHSYHEHGTGGHWCAKIIFFSLLAILISLIGLIILENRGLSELEANSVESRYSGVLEGWLEDAPDDDHHDVHTFELKHHDDDEHDQDDEDDHSPEVDHDNEQDDDDQDDENQPEDDESQEQDLEPADEDEDIHYYSKHYERAVEQDNDEDDDDNDDDDDGEDDDDDEEKEDASEELIENDSKEENIREDRLDDADDNENDDDVNESDDDDDDKEIERNYETDDDDENDNEHDDKQDNEDDDEHDEDEADDEREVDLEKLEHEPDEEPVSTELPALPEADNDDDDDDNQGGEETSNEDQDDKDVDDDEFLEADDDDDLPVIERIVAPAGKPLPEVEEVTSSEQPPDTLAEEEEYERRQAELRKEQEQTSHKDGGNSVEDDWPGEPSEAYWRQEMDYAEQDLRQGEWASAERRVGSMPEAVRECPRARWLTARTLDVAAHAQRDNRLLTRAIAAYLHLLKIHEKLSDKKLLNVTERTLERIKFSGNYLRAEPVYRLLMRRFPGDPTHYNNLTVSFLMANRADLAEDVLKETLQKWPDDRVALAHYGFVLKTRHSKLEEAVEIFKRALEGDSGAANEPRFYYHLGDALLLLGRYEEAHEVHKRGATLGHFLSPSQRSLYNVPRLKSQPWWNVEQTPYAKLARELEKSWREILKEGEAARALYEMEKEGLKDKGEWSQLDLFVRGNEVGGRCARAPVTCGIVRREAAAARCRRGQVKFSSMEAGTHVRPHVGPTNCRLRMHLGLSNTKDTYIRVDQEIRQWQVGKVLMFDDSFEHEVWHNGSGARLVLIVDVWHPDLTASEKRQLPAI